MESTSFSSLAVDRSALTDVGSRPLPRAGDSESADDFARVLGRWSPGDDGDPEHKARQAAQELVAVTFVQPLLKQLRDTNHAAEPFTPTQGEKQFQSMHDAVLAQKIVKASNFPLVERLTSDLLKKGQPAAAPTPAAPTLEVHA